MSTSPNLRLPYLDANQNQKTVTHNAALRMLDALVNLHVASAALSVPPAAPNDGQCWIVASGGTGAWLGKDLNVAAWQDGAWSFYAPNPGYVAYVDALGGALLWNGAAWVSLLGAVASLAPSTLGIGTAADPANPLSAKLNAALFAALPTTASPAGTGDVRVKLSKQAAGNTASFLFQDGFSTRAEIGLAGGDDFHVKVSPDGATFLDALVLAAATGAASFLVSPTAPTPAAGDSSTKLATTAFVAGAVAALAAAAPGALDTLKELADALGDDPNFAATMTTALAGKAPLAGPSFTGTLTSTGQVALDTGTVTTLFQASTAANIGGGTASAAYNALVSTLKNSARSVVAWNKRGGSGEINWLVNRGPGGSGGFTISDVDNSGTVTDLIGSDGAGNVYVPDTLTVYGQTVSFGGQPTTNGAFVYNSPGQYFGIYNAGNNLVYGVGGQLPSPSGTSTLGGYYQGLGIGGATSGKGNPIFGVLNSGQSGNGVGDVAFTILDDDHVCTFNSVLDDGSGNATFKGAVNAGAYGSGGFNIVGPNGQTHLFDDGNGHLETSSGTLWLNQIAKSITDIGSGGGAVGIGSQTGGTTVRGTLNVNAAATFYGPLNIMPAAAAPSTTQQGAIYTDSTLTALRWYNGTQWSRVTNFAKFAAYPGSDCYIAAATWTKVNFNDADTNDQGTFTASNSRFTAPEAGVYEVGASLAYKQNNSSAPTALQLAFYKNGVPCGRGRAGATSLVPGVSTVGSSVVLKLAAGDTVEVWASFSGADGYVAAADSCFWADQLP